MQTVFFFNDTATTEIYTLSLHDALPISLPFRLSPSVPTTSQAPPGTAYLAVLLTSSLRTHTNLDALMTTFLVVLATAELISQNRWVLVVIFGVTVFGAYYLESVDRSGALLVWLLLLQMVIAVSIGLVMSSMPKRIKNQN